MTKPDPAVLPVSQPTDRPGEAELTCGTQPPLTYAPTPPRVDWWVRARLGVSYHWGIYSHHARGEWVRSNEQMTRADYNRVIPRFAADRYEPRAWADAAKAMGAGYGFLTAKHHDGFCLYDSELTDYTSVHTPAGRDLVREFVDAFRDVGLRTGLYFSLLDWNHPDYPAFGDRQHPLRRDETLRDHPHDWDRYTRFMHGQVRELLTNYGPLDLLVFDFSYYDKVGEAWRATELVQMIRELQPDIVLNDRLASAADGNLKASHPPPWAGDFDTCELNTPHGAMLDAHGRRVPWDLWITQANSWSADDRDTAHKSAADIVRTLSNCVSKSGNLTLNFAPSARGELSDTSYDLKADIGRWMNAHGESIRNANAAPLERPDWGRWTLSADGRTLYAHVVERPMGHLTLRGLRGKVRNPRVLSTGHEAIITDFWNPNVQAFGESDDVFLNFHQPVQQTHPLPDPWNTVVAMDVVPIEQQAEEARRITVDPLRRVVF